jgi:micrococcal nuclease
LRASVVSIIDGDTIKVRRRGREDDVRLLAIDAPESSALRYGARDCGGAEAKVSMEDLLEPADQVRFATDASQDRRDRYGRVLAYVEHGGVDVGREQLRRGFAETYVFDPASPATRTERYRSAQARAERLGVGVYGLCGGDFHSSDD